MDDIYDRIAAALEELMNAGMMGSQKRELLMEIHALVIKQIDRLDDTSDILEL